MCACGKTSRLIMRQEMLGAVGVLAGDVIDVAVGEDDDAASLFVGQLAERSGVGDGGLELFLEAIVAQREPIPVHRPILDRRRVAVAGGPEAVVNGFFVFFGEED